MMKCLECDAKTTMVIDTRETIDGMTIRRRRKCKNNHRFSTLELHADYVGDLLEQTKGEDKKILEEALRIVLMRKEDAKRDS